MEDAPKVIPAANACLTCMPYTYALYVCWVPARTQTHALPSSHSDASLRQSLSDMCALYVCLICMPYMYAHRCNSASKPVLYACLICMPYMHAYMYGLYVCLICMPYMYAHRCKSASKPVLYACLICMPYMYASYPCLYVCLICMHTDASLHQSSSAPRDISRPQAKILKSALDNTLYTVSI